jgi:hypothetical protein
MAKQSKRIAFSNAVITKRGEDFYISEFKETRDGIEKSGTWSLSELLEDYVDKQYISLGIDEKSELNSEE